MREFNIFMCVYAVECCKSSMSKVDFLFFVVCQKMCVVNISNTTRERFFFEATEDF